MKFTLWIMAAALATTVLWGCYESTEVAFHEPGVYEGKQDPLLRKLRQPEFQQQLVERFKIVQTDR